MRNIHAIILAGGIGSRLGGESPKQFLSIGGKPLVVYSIEKFKAWGLCKTVNIVCHKDWILQMEAVVSPYLEGIDQIIEGGQTRHESTLKAIEALSWDEEDILFFHDAARPIFSTTELDELIGVTRTFGAGTLAFKSSETVVVSKVRSGYTEKSIPRDEVYFVKTPQAVTGLTLKKLQALGHMDPSDHPTDLCSWVEYLQEKTGIVGSSPKNIKVTTKEDIKIVESYLLD